MENVLLALDNSDASWHAVEETAAHLRNDPGLRVHLFHAIGPVPTALQEFRGAEDPVQERNLDEALKRKQDAWLEKAQRNAEPLLARARFLLEDAGAQPNQITAETADLKHRDDLAAEILRAARAFGCRRIVVGRNSYSWLGKILSDDLGEQLQKNAGDISVSVVE